MKEATQKGIGPQITQMNADEGFWSSADSESGYALRALLFKPVFHICVNLRDLRAIPDLVVACRAVFFAVNRNADIYY